ncbi:hypothetical protein MRX96_051198 [Rhipicephalus microplus]
MHGRRRSPIGNVDKARLYLDTGSRRRIPAPCTLFFHTVVILLHPEPTAHPTLKSALWADAYRDASPT